MKHMIKATCRLMAVVYMVATGLEVTAAPSAQDRREAAERGVAYLASEASGARRLGGPGISYAMNPNGELYVNALSGLAIIAEGSFRKNSDYHQALLDCAETFHVGLEKLHPNVSDGSDQRVWSYSLGIIFMAHLLNDGIPGVDKEFVRQDLQTCLTALEESQTPDGAWCHGFANVPNALNYTTFAATTIWTLQALGTARMAGFKVSDEVIDKSLEYIYNSQHNTGGVNYSPRANQNGTLNIGRSGGAWVAIHSANFADRYKGLNSLEGFIEDSIKNNEGDPFGRSEVHTGHGSANMCMLWAAWGANELDLYGEFWEHQGQRILDLQKANGEIGALPSDGDAAKGTQFEDGAMATAFFVLALSMPEGNMRAALGGSSRDVTALRALIDSVSIEEPRLASAFEKMDEAVTEFENAIAAEDRADGMKQVSRGMRNFARSLAGQEEIPFEEWSFLVIPANERVAVSYDEKRSRFTLSCIVPPVWAEGAKGTATVTVPGVERPLALRLSTKDDQQVEEDKDVRTREEVGAGLEVVVTVAWEYQGQEIEREYSCAIDIIPAD